MSGGFITGSKNATQMHALVSVCENSIINNVREISSINAKATFAKVQYLKSGLKNLQQQMQKKLSLLGK